MKQTMRFLLAAFLPFLAFAFLGSTALASEADLAIPDLHEGSFTRFGGLNGWQLLFYGSFVALSALSLAKSSS